MGLIEVGGLGKNLVCHTDVAGQVVHQKVVDKVPSDKSGTTENKNASIRSGHYGVFVKEVR